MSYAKIPIQLKKEPIKYKTEIEGEVGEDVVTTIACVKNVPGDISEKKLDSVVNQMGKVIEAGADITTAVKGNVKGKIETNFLNLDFNTLSLSDQEEDNPKVSPR